MSLSRKAKYTMWSIVAIILLVIVSLTILLSLPSTHRKLGTYLSNVLSQKTGSEITIEEACYYFPNQLTLHGINLKDQQGLSILSADEISANILLPTLLAENSGTTPINLSYAKLINPQLHIVEYTDSTFNFQFIIDNLSSPDSEGGTNISIATTIIKNLNAQFENHTDTIRYEVSNLSVNARNLLISDSKSGINLKDISLDKATIHTVSKDYEISNLSMESDITIRDSENKTLLCNIADTQLTFHDKQFTITDTEFFITGDTYNLHSVNIKSDEGFILKGKGWFKNQNSSFSAKIDDLSLTPKDINTISDLASLNESTSAMLSNLGNVSLNGTIDKDSARTALDAQVTTDIGSLTANASAQANEVRAHIASDNLYLANILNAPTLGKASFNSEITFDKDHPLQTSTITANIKLLEYGGYIYKGINIDAKATNGVTNGHFDINDPNLKLKTDFTAHIHEQSPTLVRALGADIDLYAQRMALYPLLGSDAPSSININMSGDIEGTNLQTITGNVELKTVHLVTDHKTYSFNDYLISIINKEQGQKEITVSTDFADIALSGNIDLQHIASTFQQQLYYHLPTLSHTNTNLANDINLDISLRQSEMLSNLLGPDLILNSPVHIQGNICNSDNQMQIDIDMPQITYDGNIFTGSTLSLSGTPERLTLNAKTEQDKEGTLSEFAANITAHNDIINSSIDWNINTGTDLHGTLNATTLLSDSTGNLSANISLIPSDIYFDENKWTLTPSKVNITKDDITISHLSLISGNQYLTLDGNISLKPSNSQNHSEPFKTIQNSPDTLIAHFNGFDVEYLQDLLNFHPVDFGGKLSGQAIVSNILTTPQISADVAIDSMLFETGYLGNAAIKVGWDQELKGVRINGHIVDEGVQGVQVVQEDQGFKRSRVTDVVGYVAPREVRDDIQLKITAQNTSATFIHGFLSGVFTDVKGDVNGILNVTTGPDGVNLIGNMSVDADLTLRATDMTYHINPKDSIKFQPGKFVFDMVQLRDIYGKTGYVNGKVTHQRLRNFGYDFEVDFDNFLLYDQREFNSDKFLATVFGSGNLTIKGADGHNLNMAADITPTKGSVFAYDAATPDAITGSNFITFRSSRDSGNSRVSGDSGDSDISGNPDIQSLPKYSSDTFLDLNVHINPDCAIKLRMDNNADGYITTYGTGTLLAHYHDKSPFTMQGIYNIQSGKYRLYLQDIIYRDLEIQEGSNVTFNGSPFDADIHLICHHSLSSVPLRDLTSTAEFMQNNKVKVICILDITGQLGNMNFGFDLQLPNVSDETRQLVKSLISTDEEMNMQMIYLLGLGRFYTNEMARAQGKTGSGSEVSSLVSSTISGQINNLISNAVGTNSKWSFGTGLSTGEQGWNDLDVEGTLSGSLLNDRLLINGNFGYRDNSLTNKANFVGDFDVRYQLTPNGNIYLKAYNQTNDKYFTKSTLNTQGIGISFQKSFDNWKYFLKNKNEKNDK